jgi:hypothetical protein
MDGNTWKAGWLALNVVARTEPPRRFRHKMQAARRIRHEISHQPRPGLGSRRCWSHHAPVLLAPQRSRTNGRAVKAQAQARGDALIGQSPVGSDEGRSARDGGPVDGWRKGEGWIRGGTDPDDVDAWASVGIGDELPLSMEMADRAIVGRGALLVGASGRLAVIGG